MKLKVNGKSILVEPKPHEMLSVLLREELGLTGTKIGCNEAECGACTVLVDGFPVLSCSYPAVKIAGKDVITIEGIQNLLDGSRSVNETMPDELHPIQQAFIEYGAVQCGFCIPGQIMNALALLTRNSSPSEEEICHALKDNLCRCGGYPRIIAAVKAAARTMRNEKNSGISSLPGSLNSCNIIGSVQPRPDAVDKVTGKAIFTDDLYFEGMLHARVKRSEVPHGIVKKIDVSKAKDLKGVISVITAQDIPGEKNHGLVIQDWPILVGIGERVRYVGDALVIVSAVTREIATEAIDSIEVEIQEEPVVTDPRKSLSPEAPQLHIGGNLLKHITVRKGNVEEGFSRSHVIVEHTFHTGTNDHAFIEPECSIARPTSDGRIEIYVGSQIPYADRVQVARALGWSEERVRVIGQKVGGGFGGKEDISAQIHAALLAQACDRPVKLLFDRRESLIVHPKRHATQIRVKLGADKDGSLISAETELYGDTGAYASLGEKVMTRATTHSSGPYEIPNVRADCYAVYTNNPPAGAFRGFGVTQSTFAIESAMDILAEKLGMDPISLRRMNLLQVGSVTNTGQILHESVGIGECLDRVKKKVKELDPGDPFEACPVKGNPNLRRAWGVAAAYKNTGLGGGAQDKAGAVVELCKDGIIEARTSSAEVGQGLVTVIQMIVAEEFNQPMSRVRVHLMDTDLSPDGGPTTASRQTFVTGNAVRYAAQDLRKSVVSTLAEKYDASPQNIRFDEGIALIEAETVQLGDAVGYLRAARRAPRSVYEYRAPQTHPLGEAGDMHFAFSFAVQAVQVEVNIKTGKVRVLRVITANDVGKAINPMGLQAQVEGGVMMGLGGALTERFIIDEGYVVTDRLANYQIPKIIHTPEIISIVVEEPTKDGPYGAKGVGEITSVPTAPAVTNAIYNAVGIQVDHLPVNQEEIARQTSGW